MASFQDTLVLTDSHVSAAGFSASETAGFVHSTSSQSRSGFVSDSGIGAKSGSSNLNKGPLAADRSVRLHWTSQHHANLAHPISTLCEVNDATHKLINTVDLVVFFGVVGADIDNEDVRSL